MPISKSATITTTDRVLKIFKRKLPLWIKSYICTLLFIWAAVLFYRYNTYYAGFLSSDTQQLLLLLAAAYTITAPLLYIVLPERYHPVSKSLMIFRALRRIAPQYLDYLKQFPYQKNYTPPVLSYAEKTATLFLAVKLFFLPMMINFMFSNLQSVQSNFQAASEAGNLLSIFGFNAFLFPLILTLLLLIDTAYFTFGYTVELKLLNNQVKSVEPTVLGWVVALLSYPPFNVLLGGYIIWSANDYADFGGEYTNFAAKIIIILLMSVYALSSVALGAKASNLTNRGIVSRGPYAIVRHPAYITKNLAWWLTIIPVFSLSAATGMAIWSFIYFLRAVTEERHLMRDPDYRAYCKRVRHRFIPKIV